MMRTKTNSLSKKIIFLSVLLFPLFVWASSSYVPMESIPGSTTTPKEFYAYTQAIYKFGIWAVGIAALFMITVGGYMYLTAAGNNSSMEKAKGVITDAIMGLILAMTAYLLLYIINPDLVNVKPLTGTGVITTLPGAPGGPTDCGYPVPTAGNNVCTGTAPSPNCSCNTSLFTTYINDFSAAKGIDPNLTRAVICYESGGNATKINPTSGACGLMQVMPPPGGTCASANLLDPATNIATGVQLLANKKSAAASTYSYSTVNLTQMTLASYNCCANGTNPNANSADCGSVVPKWACPTNPGIGTYNMCTVKKYACEISACVP